MVGAIVATGPWRNRTDFFDMIDDSRQDDNTDGEREETRKESK